MTVNLSKIEIEVQVTGATISTADNLAEAWANQSALAQWNAGAQILASLVPGGAAIVANGVALSLQGIIVDKAGKTSVNDAVTIAGNVIGILGGLAVGFGLPVVATGLTVVSVAVTVGGVLYKITNQVPNPYPGTGAGSGGGGGGEPGEGGNDDSPPGGDDGMPGDGSGSGNGGVGSGQSDEPPGDYDTYRSQDNGNGTWTEQYIKDGEVIWEKTHEGEYNKPPPKPTEENPTQNSGNGTAPPLEEGLDETSPDPTDATIATINELQLTMNGGDATRLQRLSDALIDAMAGWPPAGEAGHTNDSGANDQRYLISINQ